MTLAAYTGHEPLTFPDYLDLGSGKTLRAEPGGTYDIAPASGRLVSGIPEGWFSPAGDAGEGAPAEGDGAPSLGDRKKAGREPENEDEHSAP